MRATSFLSCMFCLFPAIAAEPSVVGSRPDFSGDWIVKGTNGNDASLSIKQNANDETIHIVGAPTASDKQTKFDCSIRGKECTGSFEGEPAKITVYYNGPTLVELAVRGHNGDKVTKTRRTLATDGNSLTVETTEISPPGKTENPEMICS